jgi:hypothetical protein
MKRLHGKSLLWLLLVCAIGIIEVLRIVPLTIRRLGRWGLVMLATAIVTWHVGLLSPFVPIVAGIVAYLEATISLRQIGRLARHGIRLGPWWFGRHWVWRRLQRSG